MVGSEERFKIGATVPCSVETQLFNDTTEVWANANCDALYPKVEIVKASTTILAATSMTNVATGKYRYLFDSAGKTAGFYKRIYYGKITSGAEIFYPIFTDGFWLE